MDPEKSKAEFVTFYSFKGGVGRSMALINTAGNLVSRGFRVLVIDLDLEAPGLSYLNPDAPDEEPSRKQPPPLKPGFVDLLYDAKERGAEGDLFRLTVDELAGRYTRPYYLAPEFREFPDGSLHIMSAGLLNTGYAQRFDSLNLRALYQAGLGEPLIRAFKKKFAEAGLYDYVLVDSRTGFSDEAGICTRDLADYLMILSGLNRQNVEGTCAFLKALREQTAGKKDVKFDIILSPVPNGEDELVDRREGKAKESFTEAWGAEITLELQIPYHPQLALTEEPHVFRRRRGYLFEAYRAIESRLLQALGHTAQRLTKSVDKAIGQRDYRVALRYAHQMIRLDGGKNVLSRLATSIENGFIFERSEKGSSQEKSSLDAVLNDANGRGFIEFVIKHVPVASYKWELESLAEQIAKKTYDLAKKLYERIVNADPGDISFFRQLRPFPEATWGPNRGGELLQTCH